MNAPTRVLWTTKLSMQIVMCRQLTTTGLPRALPLTKALRARIRVFLGQGPPVTEDGLAKRPQSAIAACENGCTVARDVLVCRASVPTARCGGRPGFPQILLHAGRPGLQLSTRAVLAPTNNGRPRRPLAIAGWCYGASALHSSTGVRFDAEGAVG